jgi:TolB-like protein/lipoprotein NlpI
MTPEPEHDLKIEIAHILTMDVVAYSTLLIDEQSRVMATLVQAVRATARFRQAERSEQLICLPTGDGMALVFLEGADAPLECAMEICAELRPHPEIALRMGIHSGPVKTIRDVNDRPNLAGAGIDVAQRVMDCGDAGHILLSKRVAEDLAPHSRWNCYLHDLGECEVKHGRRISLVNFYSESCGNPEPPQKLQCTSAAKSHKGRTATWAILALALCAAAAFFFLHRTVAQPRSLVVLPFADLSPAKDQEYFSEGITEQISNSLAKIPGLFVVARTSAFAFKDQDVGVGAIGRQLHVSYVLEGSVSRGANRFRVAAQLVNVNDGHQVWSETYDSSEKDILSLQSDVAQKVATALQIELQLPEKERIAKQATSDPAANDLYLRGRYLLNKRTIESTQSALGLFKQAIAKDPNFALGHAGIADSYIQLGKIGALGPIEAAQNAWPEVNAALAIDPQLSDGYVSRGILFTDYEWNWPAGEKDYRQALALNPNNASAHHWYSRHLAQIGRFDDALREIADAQQLDPLSPVIRVTKGKILLVAGRPNESIDPCLEALQLEPDFAPAFSMLGQVDAQTGNFPKSIEAAQRFVRLSQNTGYAQLELAYAYAMAGNLAASDEIVREVTDHGRAFSPYDMATIFSARHDADDALRWLQKAIDQRSVDVIWLRVDPRLENVRNDARFERLLTRLSPRKSIRN